MLIVLVLVLLYFGRSLAIKSASMNNQPCMVRSMLLNWNPDKHHYHLFINSMDRCNGSCNTAEDPFGRICVPNKTEDENLKVFNIIKGISESKTLAKHISCGCKCEFDGRKCNSREI